MNSNDHYTSLQITAAGVGVLIVTALMANGEWVVLDVAISVVILGLGYTSLQARALLLTKKWHTFIAAACFGIVTTCAAIGLISALAVISQNYALATVDVQTYKQLPRLKEDETEGRLAELYRYQMIWQTCLFLILLLTWKAHLTRYYRPVLNSPEACSPEDGKSSSPVP